jgi:hypothetical protein
MSETKIVTNNQFRPLIQAWELTEKERKEFDYLDWPAIEEGTDSAEFFRYGASFMTLASSRFALTLITHSVPGTHTDQIVSFLAW